MREQHLKLAEVNMFADDILLYVTSQTIRNGFILTE